MRNDVRREKIFNPMDVVRPVGYSRAELTIGNPPVKRMIMEKQNAGEFSGGVKVGPINVGTTVMGVVDKRLEGWVERS